MNALQYDMWYYKKHIIAKNMDMIIVPFLVRTQDYLRPVDRDALRKIHDKVKFLRHPDICECIEQWIMARTHMILSTIFSKQVYKPDWLHEIKSDMEWQMTNFVGAHPRNAVPWHILL